MKSEPKKTAPMAKKFIIGTLVLFALIALSVTALLKYPQIFQKRTSAEIENNYLISRISKLEKKVEKLEKKPSDDNTKNLTSLQVKLNDLSQNVGKSLSSKAEMQDVLRLSNQVAQMEKNMKASSSQNALILTALGLVENEAQTGKPFIYEASVLKGLCMQTELEDNAEDIFKIALNGVATKQGLIEKFEVIYHEKNNVSAPRIAKEKAPDFKTDWKAFLIYKLKHLIIIEKVKKQDQTVKTPEKEVLEIVQKGDFEKAVTLMENLKFFQTENFEIWKQSWREKENFEDLMQKMKAYALGALKVENLKK